MKTLQLTEDEKEEMKETTKICEVIGRQQQGPHVETRTPRRTAAQPHSTAPHSNAVSWGLLGSPGGGAGCWLWAVLRTALGSGGAFWAVMHPCALLRCALLRCAPLHPCTKRKRRRLHWALTSRKIMPCWD